MRKVSIPQKLLRELYLSQNLTTYQIAEKIGVCQATIWKRLHEFNIKPRLSYTPVGFTKEQLEKWYLSDKLSTWEIQKRFGYSRGTVYRKLKEFGLGTRNIALSHIGFDRHDFGEDILEKAYLIGFRIGDLNVTKRGAQSETITVKCASTKQGQIELFKNLFSKYGHIIQGKPTKSGKINIQANLNLTFSFLLDKSPGSHKWVFNNKDTFFAFLAGFSDAEGSFFVSRGQGSFAIGNYDVKLLSKIKDSLLRFGIETPLLSVHYRKGKLVSGFISRGNYFILRCGRKNYLLKLIDLLEPYIKHRDKLTSSTIVKNNILERNIRFGRALL